jgi:hypothetical protein
MSMNRTWTSEERDLLKELQRYIGKKKKTSNAQHPTPNVEVGGQMAKLAAQSSI